LDDNSMKRGASPFCYDHGRLLREPFHHCERSEAISLSMFISGDCHAADAARNDGNSP
jgi:hypothetical protein